MWVFDLHLYSNLTKPFVPSLLLPQLTAMAAENAVKGTVTPIGSLFPPDEAHKASLRVHAAIADQRQSISRLHSFIADNSALTALVQRLPDELSHEIMVPFGSAAFFPGRLIHTNELLVLIGEGYYAERTARQAVEILERRGMGLEAQVETLKGMVLDLEAEARFFETTAVEAAEGLVEIREEYIGEPQNVGPESGGPQSSSLESTKTDDSKMSIEDTEYARIMARLDELEKEEKAAAEEEAEDVEVEIPSGSNPYVDAETLDLNLEFAAKGSYKSSFEQNAPLPPEPKESLHILSELEQDSSLGVGSQTFTKSFDGRKAFTGSVIEHTQGLRPIESSKSTLAEKPSDSNTTKPVSRFKLQRANR